MNITRTQRQYFKSVARKKLLSDWVTQTLAFLIITALFSGLTGFGYSLYDLLSNIGINSDYIYIFPAFYTFLSLFVTVPLIVGVFYFEYKAVKKEKCEVSDVFATFGSDFGISRAYRIFICFVLRCIPGFLPAIALWVYRSYFYDSSLYGYDMYGIDVSNLGLNILLVIAVLLGMAANADNLVGLYFAARLDSDDIPACFLMAKSACRTSRGEILLCALSFVPLFVLSLFTLGFLLVAYTLPYFLLTLVYMSEYLYENAFGDESTDRLYCTMFENTYEYTRRANGAGTFEELRRICDSSDNACPDSAENDGTGECDAQCSDIADQTDADEENRNPQDSGDGAVNQ